MQPHGGLEDFLVAFGLMLALEGVLYTAMPGFMKEVLSRARELPDSIFRWGGLTALALGVAIIWAARG